MKSLVSFVISSISTLTVAISFAGLPAFKAKAGLEPKAKAFLKPLAEGAEVETVGDMYARLFTYVPVPLRAEFEPYLKDHGHLPAPKTKLDGDSIVYELENIKLTMMFEQKNGETHIYLNGRNLNQGKALTMKELVTKIQKVLDEDNQPGGKKAKVA